MSKGPWRKIGKESVIIETPEPNIILDKDFDYGKYADEYFKDTLASRDDIYQGYLEDLKDTDSSIMLEEFPKGNTDEAKDNKDYNERIIELQKQYEEAFQKGCSDEINEYITKSMQYIASEYLTKIDIINDTNELNNLSGKTR